MDKYLLVVVSLVFKRSSEEGKRKELARMFMCRRKKHVRWSRTVERQQSRMPPTETQP
jgi:hypothetical protein